MRVFFTASESMPFASTGGLGEVAYALPRALARSGVDAYRIMPYYRQIREAAFPVTPVGLEFDIPLGNESTRCDVLLHHAHDDVPTYFVRHAGFFDRAQLYSLPNSDYDDNFQRFILFQKAVVALIDHLNIRVDILHANDWQTGFLPLFLRYGIDGKGRVAREKCLYTIHNLAYQGCFPGHQFSLTNLPGDPCFGPDCAEYYGSVNSMKAGLVTADWVSTVSRNYARQVMTQEYGNGLDGVLRGVRDHFSGIPNGIDTESWNPLTDKYLEKPFSADSPGNKQNCRKALQHRLDLKSDTSAPVFAMVSRLDVQKGFKLIGSVLPFLMESEAQLVILGTGSDYYQQMCRQWQASYPEQIRTVIGFDVELAHQIYGGADMMLMPSLFEPCGLNQMQALRYGTIPIVHATGGLADTIHDVTADPDKGNGYTFAPADPDAFRDALERALAGYRDKGFWGRLQSRALRQDFSWDRTAKPYIDLYHQMLTDPVSRP